MHLPEPGRVHTGGMAHEFRPGHPVLFWSFILLMIFLIYSGAAAMINIDQCGDQKKAWAVWPPGWVCGADHNVQLTR